MRKFICLFYFLYSIFYIPSTYAQQPTIYPGETSVNIGAQVGEVKINISGFVTPHASIVLTSDGQFLRSTTADQEGLFTITDLFVRAGFSRFCLTTVDFKRIGESETCLTIEPVTSSRDIKDIFLPPTVGLFQKQINAGQTAQIYGYSMPEASVDVKITSTKSAQAKADVAGYYEYRYKNVPAGTYLVSSVAQFQGKSSLEPTKQVKLEALSVRERLETGAKGFLERLFTFITTTIFGYILLLLALIIIIIILFVLIKRRGIIKRIKKQIPLHHDWFPIALLFLFLINPKCADAASLLTASDTITTSRPSPATPLSKAASASDTFVNTYSNGSRFLESDIAKIIRSTSGAIIDSATTVASESSDLKTVYFSEMLGNGAESGLDVIFLPITALHEIKFKTQTTIPTGGDILISFPTLASGDANNEASPSASTFQLNDLDSNTSNIKLLRDGTEITSSTTVSVSNPTSGTSPKINITLNSGTIAAGSIVKIFLGCSQVSSNNCSLPSPQIINPTKKSAAGTGDRWNITIQTRNASDVELDRAVVRAATIESSKVLVTVGVEPSFTFTIGGILNGAPINDQNSYGCTNSETTNSGVSATAENVNLGLLSDTPQTLNAKIANIAAQLITVTTNASNGYVLTTLASGPLSNTKSNFSITSVDDPSPFPKGSNWFGIHPCGLDVSEALWTTGQDQACNSYVLGSDGNLCKYGWPDNIPLIIASDPTGPVGNNITNGNGFVSVEYAAGIDNSVPGGNYQTVITYLATPTF